MTTQNLERLPKWAQDYILTLQRERQLAIRALNQYCDNQTHSPFFIEELECTGEENGPSRKVRFIQTHKVSVEWHDVILDVLIRPDRTAIEMRWSKGDRSPGRVAFIPTSFQAAELQSFNGAK